jgi:hypothetical protein
MALRFRKSDEGLEIEQAGNIWAKLMGLPFLAAGLYLLWQLVSGVIGLFVPSWGAITGAGLIVLPVFIAFMGIPGWLLIVSRKRTLIDVAHRQVVEIFDHLVYRQRKVRPVPRGAVVRIRLDESQVTGKDARTVVLRLVEIAGSAEDPIRLAVLGEHDVEEARALAMEAAGALGLGLDESTPPQAAEAQDQRE